ncbi:MAG: VWA domain-containing protein [Treponema sp.]|jgi:Ca-activated chloride channel family protein|nr:VWA domain-containing protein [Treponema sp.]
MAVTEGLSFEYPRLLFGFAVLVPLVFFEALFFRRRFAGAAGRNRLAGSSGSLPPPLLGRILLSRACFMLCLACLVAALAGPRWGRDRAPGEYRRGLDVVIAVDVSRSMEIRDSAGDGGECSRLERGLAVACETVKALPGVRFAAAVSRGRGLVTVPLTWDRDAVLNFLEALDGSSLTGRGTNLESLVDAASGAFQPSFPARKAIVLISDGEALGGSLKAAVDRSAGQDITVNTLAVGSDEGGPVPEGKFSRPENPVRDSGEEAREKEQIISRRDPAVMRMAAERSGGIYVDGNRKDAPAQLAERLRSGTAESETRGTRGERKRRWPLFVIAALLFYGASKLCLLCPLSFLRCLALIVFLSSCSGVSGKLFVIEANFFNSRGLYSKAAASYLKALAHEEAEPYAEYGLGSAYYSLDEAAAALARFGDSRKILEGRSPAEHRELRYRLSYNTGVVLFGEGKFRDAAESFREALKIDPGRIEAKRNLELSLLSLARSRAGEGQAEPERSEPENSAALFEYLRRKEQNQWRSREWVAEEEDSGPDY